VWRRDRQRPGEAPARSKGFADGAGTRTLEPDWPRLLAELDAGTSQLKEIFLR
jgi:hypothetical protein